MKKILAAALSLLFILAITVPGFADGDTVVTMEVLNAANPEDCEWTLTIPANFSVSFEELYNGYKNIITNHPEGVDCINVYPYPNNAKDFSLDITGLPKNYQISVNTTHTPFSSADTDTILNYGFTYEARDFFNGNSYSYSNRNEVSFTAENKNMLEGKSGVVTACITALVVSDIDSVGVLKSGSYSSTITFTSQLEPMA